VRTKLDIYIFITVAESTPLFVPVGIIRSAVSVVAHTCFIIYIYYLNVQFHKYWEQEKGPK